MKEGWSRLQWCTISDFHGIMPKPDVSVGSVDMALACRIRSSSVFWWLSVSGVTDTSLSKVIGGSLVGSDGRFTGPWYVYEGLHYLRPAQYFFDGMARALLL